jgi:hypothetical protein
LAKDEVFKVAGWRAIQFADGGFAGEKFGGFFKPGDAENGIAGCCGDMADFRVGFWGEGDDVSVEGGSFRLIDVECAAADSKDDHRAEVTILNLEGNFAMWTEN